ncbi:MAG: NAD-dependent epimerase/dehydratase family protein [Cyanobacteria bacterium SZAS-4]|nr:NAD-dependent epimerase/dehydratase family protein [Cyanobacteria bacterium SZAS-4]
MLKSLVIGATGYIGNVVAERLVQNGHTVLAGTRSEASADKLRKQGMEPVIANIEQPESIVQILPEVDLVVYVAYAYNNEQRAIEEMQSGTSHLTDILQAMSNSQKTFILTSGTGVVGDSTDIVYDENTPFPETNSPITLMRRNLESEVCAAAKLGIRTIVLRPPTVYGRGGSFVVPRYLMDYALKHRESVYVEGTENNKRAAVHVDDLADLFLLALEKAKAGELFNTAAETGVRTIDIAESISRAAGLGGHTRAVPLAESREIFGHWGVWWAQNNQCTGDKARKLLGWNPHRLSLLQDIETGSYAPLPAR